MAAPRRWLVILQSLTPSPSLSQLRPDDSLPENSRLVPEGNQIRIEGGTVRGDTLFHSFQEFSIPESLEVHLDNAPNLETIITRVTGSTSPNSMDISVLTEPLI